MIPVIIYDECQCDPKKCTAKRMLKFGLGREAKTLREIPSGSIVLSPFSDRALSPADIRHARRGLVVMDLTWTNIDGFPRLKRVEERALPYLLASNPINWGRPMELNSAEAVMASLIILGEKEQAEAFVPRFNWAPEFLRLNGAMLEDYSRAADSAEVVRIQDGYVRSVLGERSRPGSSGQSVAGILRFPFFGNINGFDYINIYPDSAITPERARFRCPMDSFEYEIDVLGTRISCFNDGYATIGNRQPLAITLHEVNGELDADNYSASITMNGEKADLEISEDGRIVVNPDSELREHTGIIQVNITKSVVADDRSHSYSTTLHIMLIGPLVHSGLSPAAMSS